MPSLDEVIQVSEDISYPDGYNKVTIEGTGDEGGLGIGRYPAIDIRAFPSSLRSDGIARSRLDVYVVDYQDPNFYKVKELVEVVDITSTTGFSVGSYITAISGVLSNGKVMGVYEYDGEDLNGDPLLTGAVVPLDPTRPFSRQNIIFRDPRSAGMITRLVVVYKGVATVSFNVGYDNEDWYTAETFPENDPAWQPAEPSEPGGTVIPSTCPFGQPGATPGSWMEGRFVSGGYESNLIEFMPTAGSSGLATVNVNYNGFKKYTQLTIENGTPLADASITLTAEPSSIQINTETSVLEVVIVTSDNHDPVGTPVVFSQYTNPNPPDYGNLQFIGGYNDIIGNMDKEVEVSSSDKRTINLSYMINTITSIKAIPPPGQNWSWTWSQGAETIEGTTIHLPEANELPLDATPLIVKGNMKGIATTTVRGVALGEVIVVASVGDSRPTATVTVTKDSSNGSMSLTAEPSTLGFGETSVVSAIFPEPGGSAVYTLVPEGENARTILNNGGLLGTLTMPTTTSTVTLTEDQEPSDLRTISVSQKITAVTDITTANGRHPTVASFEGSTITLQNALELEDFQTLTVVYTTDVIARGEYVAPNNKMTVKVLARQYQSDIVQSVTITTSTCPEYRFDVVNCTPDVLDYVQDGKPERIYAGTDASALVTMILTTPDPGFSGPKEAETLTDRLPAANVWVKIFRDADKKKCWEGKDPNATPGWPNYPPGSPYSGRALTPTDPQYVLVKTGLDGTFSFRLHPASTYGKTTITVVISNAEAETFEENQDLYCALTHTLSYTTSLVYDATKVKSITMAQIGVFFQPWAKNNSAVISKEDTIILTEGNVSDFGILEEAAERNGFTESDPLDNPVKISYTLKDFYRFWIKRIYLEGSNPRLDTAQGGCFRFEGDPGFTDKVNVWAGPTGPGLHIEVVPEFQLNAKDYSFTIVDASRPKEGDTKAPAPVPGARVELVDTSDMFNRSVVYSDQNGKVTFYALTPGTTYNVYITSEGYRPNCLGAVGIDPTGVDADVDNANDMITIPQFGYSSTDKYVLKEGLITLKIMADIYDTGAEEPEVAPIGSNVNDTRTVEERLDSLEGT